MYCQESEFNPSPYYDSEMIDIEKKFVLNTNFKTGGYNIDCGLSSARNYEPSVKLSTNEDSLMFGGKMFISFDYMQWMMLTEILNLNEANDIRFIDDISVTTTTVNGFKMIMISRKENHLYLISDDVAKILEFNKSFLRNRLEMLMKLDFKSYYKNFLITITNIKKDSSKSIEELIGIFCQINPSIENLILCECMISNENNILCDIEKYL